MQSFADINNTLLEQLDPQLGKAAKAARVRDAFANALVAACDSESSARYMLSHIQAVYVMRDEAPQRANGGKPAILLRIYSDDATVRAELDARQEWIRIQLARQGITYDKMRLHASSFKMRQRKPFERQLAEEAGSDQASAQDVSRHTFKGRDIEEMTARVENKNVSDSLREALMATSVEAEGAKESAKGLSNKERRIMVDRLEVLKRAFCLVFGAEADAVLDKVNAAYLIPLPQGSSDRPPNSRRRLKQPTRCVLYSSDPRFAEVMSAYGDQIRSEAWRLGLYIRGKIRIAQTPQAAEDSRAFPPMGAPRIVDLKS